LTWVQSPDLKTGIILWSFHSLSRYPYFSQTRDDGVVYRGLRHLDNTIGGIPSGPIALDVSRLITVFSVPGKE